MMHSMRPSSPARLPSEPPGAEGPDDLDDLPWPKAVPGAPPASRPGQGQGQGAHATEAEVAEAIGRWARSRAHSDGALTARRLPGGRQHLERG